MVRHSGLRFATLFLLISIFCPVALSPNVCVAGDAMHVTFLSPSTDSEHPFWNMYIRFMAAAADDLGIELDVVTASDRFAMADSAREIMMAADRPDYLVTLYHKGNGVEILDAAEKFGVPVYLINMTIPTEERRRVGAPREKYTRWIGHMYPDDASGGFLLARTLASACGWSEEGGLPSLHMAAISGARDSSAALDRNRGLRLAASKDDSLHLGRLLFARWDREIAYKKAILLLKQHPDIRAFWTASDSMALGVGDAVKAAGKTPGKDVLIGGFDWTQQGLEGIEKGFLTASVGGHFMDGGWALVLLYDRHNGLDFAEKWLEYPMPMHLLDAHNVGVGRTLLNQEKWDSLDFKRFSRVHNGGKDYDFSLDTILDCMR